ncbi:hypothetical protein DL96DRAFT_1551068 [Flagelloscypha sp. PMI_526]|nr:hypothetical protein DL96DRAFT_1551068 [Flagelloscypha sp. PMI_526]
MNFDLLGLVHLFSFPGVLCFQWNAKMGMVPTESLRKTPTCHKCGNPMRGHSKTACSSIDIKPKIRSSTAPVLLPKIEPGTPSIAELPTSISHHIFRGDENAAPGPSTRPPGELVRASQPLPFSIPPDGRRINPFARVYNPPASPSRRSESSMVPTLVVDAIRPQRSASIVASSSDSSSPLDARTLQHINARSNIQKRFGFESLSIHPFCDMEAAIVVAKEYNDMGLRSLLHSRTVRKGSTSASLVMNSPFWVIVYEDFGDVRVLLQALQNEEMEEPQMPSPLPVVEAPPEPGPAQELIPPLRLTRSPSFTNVLSYVLLVGATLAVNKFVLP